MSTLPTPRTDAVAKQIGSIAARWTSRDIGAQLFSDLCEQQFDHLRSQERELAEAKAERDALKAIERSYNAQRDLPSDQRTIPDDDAGRAAYWKGRAKSVEGDFAKLSDSLLQEGEAKDRWRALAEELAGALEHYEHCCIEGGKLPAREPLTRFRDAANPAPARTPPGTNVRSGDGHEN